MNKVLLEIDGLPEETFTRGTIVLKEGVPGTKVYVLKEGSVSVHAAGNQICKVNTPGTIFGEISSLLEADHSATVIAESDSTFHVIKNLPKLLDENPIICKTIAKVLALRVINMNLLYAELKHELEGMPSITTGSQAGNKIYDILSEIDEFWGQNVFDPFGKKRNKAY